jgi:hypothetical protein
MPVYQATGGMNDAWVFSAGAPDWSLALDVFTDDNGNFPSTRYLRVHPAIAQMTRNILAKFGGLGAPDPLIDEAYSATVPGGCFVPGQSFSVYFTAPQGRRTADWRGDGLGGDAVALHLANQSDDFLVHQSLINAGGRTSFYETFNTPQAPLPVGTYTADYMTMDLRWESDWVTKSIRDNLRTIWRGAKSSTFHISTSCPN